MLVTLLASIPSPSSGTIHLGPLRLTAYGLMIALGVVAAVVISRRRAPSRGFDPDAFSSIATWAVPAGLLGARLYHVITDWHRFRGDYGEVFKIWNGGLGIPGGLLVGVSVGVIVARRYGIRPADGLDVVAPAIPVAQAIARWGNWWNQELFGRPTSLPWGLEISPGKRPERFAAEPTFHPAFLYEGLWNLTLAFVLVRLDRRRVLRRGQLFWLYVAGYGLGRLWIESLRVDDATLVGPFRVNIWISLAAIVGGLVGFAVQQVRGERRGPAADEVAGALDDDPPENELTAGQTGRG